METLKGKVNRLIIEYYQNIEKLKRLEAKGDALADKLENRGDDGVTIDHYLKLAAVAKGMMRLHSKVRAHQEEIRQVKALLKAENGPH